jgi:sugar/nucleoside kinase (ribokinase family)
MEVEVMRESCAAKLQNLVGAARALKAFVGLDGFVDEIIHVVDKRESAEVYQRMTSMRKLSERIGAAAGKSTNLEVVVQRTKLGGNGPIMANALASFGVRVTYLGILGYPKLHPVFEEFAKRAEVHSIADPGHTDALEFDDGKVMVGKHESLTQMTWANLEARFGRKKMTDKLAESDLVAFVNWTMLPYMSGVWEAVQQEICPSLNGKRRKIFFDLADPEKRTRKDILHALELIAGFEKYFEVIFGVNEKEAVEVGKALGLKLPSRSRDGLGALAKQILEAVPVSTLLVHPVKWALALDRNGAVSLVDGPFTEKPLITTGAGDHFNAGFCLGKLLGFENLESVLLGVSTSGFYVRSAQSPSVPDLVKMLRNWPKAG